MRNRGVGMGWVDPRAAAWFSAPSPARPAQRPMPRRPPCHPQRAAGARCQGKPTGAGRATGPVPGAPKPNAKLAPVTPSPAGTGAPKTPGAGMPPAAAGQPKPGFSAQAPGRSRPVRSLCENKAQLRRPRRRRPIPQRRRPNRLRQLPSPLRVVGRCGRLALHPANGGSTMATRGGAHRRGKNMRRIAFCCLVMASASFATAAVARHAHHRHPHHTMISTQARAPAESLTTVGTPDCHVQGRLLRAAHHCPPEAVAAAPPVGYERPAHRH